MPSIGTMFISDWYPRTFSRLNTMVEIVFYMTISVAKIMSYFMTQIPLNGPLEFELLALNLR